jgi:hypothetical protein
MDIRNGLLRPPLHGRHEVDRILVLEGELEPRRRQAACAERAAHRTPDREPARPRARRLSRRALTRRRTIRTGEGITYMPLNSAYHGFKIRRRQ